MTFTVRATISGARQRLETFDGAGDLLHAVVTTATLGLRNPCNGCRKVEAWLNEKIPNPLTRKDANHANPKNS